MPKHDVPTQTEPSSAQAAVDDFLEGLHDGLLSGAGPEQRALFGHLIERWKGRMTSGMPIDNVLAGAAADLDSLAETTALMAQAISEARVVMSRHRTDSRSLIEEIADSAALDAVDHAVTAFRETLRSLIDHGLSAQELSEHLRAEAEERGNQASFAFSVMTGLWNAGIDTPANRLIAVDRFWQRLAESLSEVMRAGLCEVRSPPNLVDPPDDTGTLSTEAASEEMGAGTDAEEMDDTPRPTWLPPEFADRRLIGREGRHSARQETSSQ